LGDRSSTDGWHIEKDVLDSDVYRLERRDEYRRERDENEDRRQ
jgi:hypothetical protein